MAAAARYSVTSPNLESSLRGAPIRHTRRVPPRGNRAKPQDPCQPHPRTKFGDLKMPPKLVRKSGSAHSTISPTCFPAGMTASELASACSPKSECDTHARCRQKRFAYQRSLRILIPPYGGSNPGAPAILKPSENAGFLPSRTSRTKRPSRTAQTPRLLVLRSYSISSATGADQN